MKAIYRTVNKIRVAKRGSKPVEVKEFEADYRFIGEMGTFNKTEIVTNEEGYMFPVNALEKSTIAVADALPDNLKKSLEEVKNKDLVKDILNRSNYSTKGSVIGCGIGALVALHYNKSLMWFALGGLVAGGLIGRWISESTKSETETTEETK